MSAMTSFIILYEAIIIMINDYIMIIMFNGSAS
jgi:hypothetical protein